MSISCQESTRAAGSGVIAGDGGFFPACGQARPNLGSDGAPAHKGGLGYEAPSLAGVGHEPL